MIDMHALSVNLGRTQALRALDTRFEAGRLYGLAGPNGSGKSTLLKAVAGLVGFTGDIRIAGEALADLPLKARAARIGYLPQERAIAWNLSAQAVVELGLMRRPASERAAVSRSLLERVGMGDHAQTGVFHLSGGQRARVLLARLMATQCPVLLLDEPLAALDPAWQRQILRLLKAMAAQGHTVIVSLHDLGLAAQMCDEVRVLSDGRLVGAGAPEAVFTPALLREVFDLSGEARHEADGVRLWLSPEPVFSSSDRDS